MYQPNLHVLGAGKGQERMRGGSFVLRQTMHSFPYWRKRSRKVHQVDRGLDLDLNGEKIEPMRYPEKDEGNRK
jgi:hypothetical protein